MNLHRNQMGILMIASLTVLGCQLQGQRRPVEPADLVFVNGKILTVDANEGIAVLAGNIAAVGTNAEIRSHIGDRTQVIDLRGRTVTPGLIDTIPISLDPPTT